MISSSVTHTYLWSTIMFCLCMPPGPHHETWLPYFLPQHVCSILLQLRQNIPNKAWCVFKCPLNEQLAHRERKGEIEEGVMEQKQKREERRSQLEDRALVERPEKLFVKADTHSKTHNLTNINLQHLGKATQKHSQAYLYIYTNCSEALAKFDCETVKSQENPAGARAKRNVLKLGHSLREVSVNKWLSARQDLSINCGYSVISVRICVCHTGQYAASLGSHREREKHAFCHKEIQDFSLFSFMEVNPHSEVPCKHLHYPHLLWSFTVTYFLQNTGQQH